MTTVAERQHVVQTVSGVWYEAEEVGPETVLPDPLLVEAPGPTAEDFAVWIHKHVQPGPQDRVVFQNLLSGERSICSWVYDLARRPLCAVDIMVVVYHDNPPVDRRKAKRRYCRFRVDSDSALLYAELWTEYAQSYR